jgi:uncharacterized protein (TIGR00288 family)
MVAAPHGPMTPLHAPNAALLIDFDNVTMGIRSDLGKELRSLLSSEIIKGKVAVQRAYADWRRYPQYIVPLSEASIDLIFAPAYGSSKKNATDIRLAIDALELVFTRPEIGTFILLSGDSDFSSLVIKLKEYGKYVIGVGIRESSSDLLVQNCDEYYSYNALAGLVKASDEVDTRKFDPWELVTEAVSRMKRNGDVMRSDRLKQVMQEIDATFDERNLGIAKFSRFCQEAAQRGLLAITKLENGQLEIDLPNAAPATETRLPRPELPSTELVEAPADERARRGRRGRGGRGRERDERPAREPRAATPAPADEQEVAAAPLPTMPAPAAPVENIAEVRAPAAEGQIGVGGERLTRAEAFDLVRRTVADLTSDDDAVRASDVRRRARQLLGRDSESLSDRMFVRILKDAHDEGLIDLRKRGDDFEVARAAEAAPVAEQLAQAERATAPTPSAAPSAAKAATPRIGMGPRGAGQRVRGRPGAPPPELLSIGIVEEAPAIDTAHPAAPPVSGNGAPPIEAPIRARGGRGRGKKSARAATPAAALAAPAAEVAATVNGAAPGADEAPPAPARRGSRGGAKRAPAKRGKKNTGSADR